MEALKGLYHADKLDEQTFIDNFTIRLKEYRQIIDNLLQQKKKPLQHFLITGKRGMGKSTLLRRIYIEASAFPLNEKLLTVRLGAEQYRLSRLFKLWEMVIEQLGNSEPSLLMQKKELEKSKQYEDNLLPIINDYLTKTGKTLLLLIDNFDQFIEKIPTKDQHALREALMIYPIQIIGNTVFYNENFKDYSNPFFDFFKPLHLANLDKNEAEEFIKLRAAREDIEDFENTFNKQKGKIAALRILSGGVPRTLLILLSIVSKKNTGDAVDYLNEMIEQVTPLYQDRMKSLSSQQQEIMHHLAMRWDRTPVRDLAAEMRIPSKSISAQLVQLEKSGYIKKIDIPGRNRYYEIDERFFNIWLLMSEANPYDTKRVIWLTKWLDAFYSNDELKDFASFCQKGLRTAKPGNRFLIVQALSESEKLGNEHKKQLINKTVEDLKDKISEVKSWADTVNRKLTENDVSLSLEIQRFINELNFESALDRLKVLERNNESAAFFGKGYLYSIKKDIKNAVKNYLLAIEKGDVASMFNIANLYEVEKKDMISAEKYYLMAANNGDIKSMVNLGHLYENEIKNIEKAIEFYQMAIEHGNVKSMLNLANLFENETDNIADAEKYYKMAIDRGDTTAMIALGYLNQNRKKDIENAEKYYKMGMDKGNIVATSLLGYLYQHEKNDIDSAEKYYLLAADKGNVGAMVGLGHLYENQKRDIIAAEKYYQMAVAEGDNSALLRLGYFYQETKKDLAAAEKYYNMGVDRNDTGAMVALGYLYETEKKDVINAEKYYLMASGQGSALSMYFLGWLYENKKKDIINAEKYYLMSAAQGDSDAMYSLGNLYENEKKDIIKAEKYYLMAVEKGDEDAVFNLGYLYEEKKDIVKAEKYYLMAVEKGDADAMFNLANLYENEKKDIIKAEKYYLMSVEKGDADAMFNLANLYQNQKKDVDAEKYYLMAVEKGDADAMSYLAILYFYRNNLTQKEKALHLSENAVEKTKWSDIEILNNHIKMLFWNEKVKEASQLMMDMVKSSSNNEDAMESITEAFQYFLVFRQKQFLYKVFTSNTEWIDQYKPVYYALLSEMRDEHLKEYLKMTSELEEPVKAILDFVYEERKRLGV